MFRPGSNPSRWEGDELLVQAVDLTKIRGIDLKQLGDVFDYATKPGTSCLFTAL
jgi:hypothetical protein